MLREPSQPRPASERASHLRRARVRRLFDEDAPSCLLGRDSHFSRGRGRTGGTDTLLFSRLHSLNHTRAAQQHALAQASPPRTPPSNRRRSTSSSGMADPQAGCSRVIAETAYETITATTRIPTITGTRTAVVNLPVVRPHPLFYRRFSLLTRCHAQSTLSTYIGTIRGQVTQEVFTITGVQRGCVAPPGSQCTSNLAADDCPS